MHINRRIQDGCFGIESKARLKPHRLLSSADTVELAVEHFGQLSSNWDLPQGAYMDPCCPDYDCGDSA